MEDFVHEPHPDKAGKCPACNYPQYPIQTEQIKPYISHASEIIECVNCGFTAHEDLWFHWDYSCYMAGITDLL